MSLLAQLDQKIAANGGLIVSCQPVPDSPLDKPEIVAAMALAAEQAGAVAIRIEGVANLQATRAVVSVPIIGAWALPTTLAHWAVHWPQSSAR